LYITSTITPCRRKKQPGFKTEQNRRIDREAITSAENFTPPILNIKILKEVTNLHNNNTDNSDKLVTILRQ
jgi:hypothetical protein